jgi:hypothetical protein
VGLNRLNPVSTQLRVLDYGRVMLLSKPTACILDRDLGMVKARHCRRFQILLYAHPCLVKLIKCCEKYSMGWDSSVGTATSYGMDCPGIESR